MRPHLSPKPITPSVRYPALPSSASYYKGSPAMYERAGYRPHKRFERFTCVRKPL